MGKLDSVGKVAVIAVIAVVVILGIILYSSGNHSNGNPSAASTGLGTGTSAGGPVAVNAPSSLTSPASPQKQPTSYVPAPRPTIQIFFVTPVKGDIWTTGSQNLISWNKAGGISGSLSLIDSATKAFIGVILPQVGPNQTSFAWNTRDVFLSRTNPLKKDVTPGTYQIRILYDGNGIQPVTSPAFTITN